MVWQVILGFEENEGGEVNSISQTLRRSPDPNGDDFYLQPLVRGQVLFAIL